MSRRGVWLPCVIITWFFACWPVGAGLYVNTVSPGNVPWPGPGGVGGVVPYVIDPTLTAAQQQTYLNALREYELAANVQFVPRATQAQYIFFKYNPAGFDSVSGSNPQVVEVSSLTRAQICHEMGHSFGLLHEHTRGDRDSRVTVLSANIVNSNQNQHWFDIDPNGTAYGSYDFESVMHFPRDLFSVQPGVLDTLQAKSGFERFQPRMGGLALSKGDRAVMSNLYPPAPTLSSVVTNTTESRIGSLRAAMYYAVDNPGTTITFNIPTSDSGYANGVFTIRLTGHLPPLVVDGTTIDGTTQPGYAGRPLIVLDGSQILPEAGSVPGMLIYAANCTVKGLSFQRFPWVGLALLLPDANHNTVRGCWFGLDYSGTASAPNQYQGIQISNGANSNTIGGITTADRNVISGNNQYGIWISDPTTTGNVVLGNYIGTSADGLAAVPNAISGLIVTGSTHDNLIGGTSSGAGNTLSGNSQYGIWISGANTTGNAVQGNDIGTSAGGLVAVPNGLGGLIVTDSAHNNSIGGTSSGARNIISGNVNAGVWLTGAGVNQNTVRGNYIGLSANGGALPNTFAGLYILQGAQNNLVADNVISGNTSEGLRISDAGTSGNMVQGNLVGVAPGGSTAIGNGSAGVTIYAGATGNIIGGTTAAQRNILSGNGSVDLVFGDSGTSNNIAQGNLIGLDATGTSAIVGTNTSGVGIQNGAQNNLIGGTAAGSRNFICGHQSYGIYFKDFNTTGNMAQGNTIGLNLAGSAVSNSRGVAFYNNAQSNTVGGSTPGASNVISGNTNEGVVVYSSGSTTIKETFSRNSIFANGGKGIALYNGGNNSQPSPTITSATLSTMGNPNGTDVIGSLTAAATTGYTIEFFANPTANLSGEGRFFIGSINVTTNGGGTANFNPASLPAVVPANYVITATATDPATGNTSEFSSDSTVLSSTDTDHDGIPDNWMIAHFGQGHPIGLASDKTRAGDDFDGTGMTNLQKFLAGLDPKNPNSVFRISSIAPNSGNPQIGFQSVSGKTYRLDYRNDLVTGSWLTLTDQIFATGATTQVTDSSTAGLSRRFYRISLEP